MIVFFAADVPAVVWAVAVEHVGLPTFLPRFFLLRFAEFEYTNDFVILVLHLYCTE